MRSNLSISRRLLVALAWLPAVGLSILHGIGIWVGFGGWSELTGPWPLARHDHPQHFHNAVVARPLFRITGTNAGYDPSFMAGYAKSILSDSSSTLSDVVVSLFGAAHPILVYKLYVLVAGAGVPWLVIGAGLLWRLGPGAIASAVLFYLLNVWTYFDIFYVELGMLAYFLSVPLGLVTTAAIANFLEWGGFGRWALAAGTSVLLVFVHVTSPMIVAPAAIVAYVAAARGARSREAAFPLSRHAGVWAIPALVLILNAFWWLPALWLIATKGQSDLALVNPEPVLGRLWTIATSEAPVLVMLWGGVPLGLVALGLRRRGAAMALGTFMAAGFFWGYLAGAFRTFDPLQPGRHTYAFYTGAALATGIGLADIATRLRRACPDGLSRWFALTVAVIGLRVFGPGAVESIKYRLKGPEPFLSSRPTAALRWVVDNVKKYVPPGSRLLYEEGGLGKPDFPDVFGGGRYSGLLPHLAHVELLGGPFLHVTQTTNFTQFGEGKLFGKAKWDRKHFERYARLYRPTAIICWSAHARAFCRNNPDLIEVLKDNGLQLLGRVKGFEGDAIEGSARVEAAPGRLRVRGLVPGPDGSVVLKYHTVPCLRTVPPVPWEPVLLEDDPVPFIRLRPTADTVNVEVHFPPRASR